MPIPAAHAYKAVTLLTLSNVSLGDALCIAGVMHARGGVTTRSLSMRPPVCICLSAEDGTKLSLCLPPVVKQVVMSSLHMVASTIKR